MHELCFKRDGMRYEVAYEVLLNSLHDVPVVAGGVCCAEGVLYTVPVALSSKGFCGL